MEKSSYEVARLEKRQYWEKRIKFWQESGLTQKEFCRQNNLRDNQLTYWKKRFIKPETKPVTFIELQVAGRVRSLDSRRSAIRLNIGDEYQVEVDPGFDADVLKQVVCLLGEL